MQAVHQKADAALLRDAKDLVRRENTLLGELIEHLQVIEKRRLFAKLGFGSMFEYATRELHLSEGAAFSRIRAARLARDFPVVLASVAAGELHLSGLVVLAPHLTQANATQLVAAATHRSKRDIEKLVADLSPQPPQPMVLRPSPPVQPAQVRSPSASRPPPVASLPTEMAPAAPARVELKPMAATRYRLHLDVTSRTRELLDELHDLQGSAVDDGKLAGLLEDALAREVERRRKQKFATTDKPRSSVPEQSTCPSSRAIPAAVRRAVAARDEFCCTFVGDNGRRCESRTALEFHHVQPFARGGQHTVDGITLRCRAHNMLAAVQDFGAHTIDAAVRRQRGDAGRRRALAGGSPLSTGAVRRLPPGAGRAPLPVGNDGGEPHDSAENNSHRRLTQQLMFGTTAQQADSATQGRCSLSHPSANSNATQKESWKGVTTNGHV